MKKFLALMLCLVLVFSVAVLASCDESKDDTTNSTPQSTADSTPASSTDNGSADNGGTGDSTPNSDGTGNGGTGNSGSGSGVENLNGKTPEELYQAALNKVADLTNYEMSTTQVITMSAQGQSLTINQVVVSKMNGQDLYVNTTNDYSPESNMTCWYVDEWFYVIQDGVYGKANITYERMVNEFMPEGATSEGALMNIPESWFKEVRFEQDENGYYIEFIVSGEEYMNYMESTALAGYLDGVDDVSYKIYFTEDGELGDIITEFDYVVDGVDCHAVSTTVISNIDTTEIEAPSGEFVDVTGQI